MEVQSFQITDTQDLIASIDVLEVPTHSQDKLVQIMVELVKLTQSDPIYY
ncbi:MAG: hypothetical protein SAL70_40680 [Scytonema sp. PMC 1070.18]|nr:hypothetical protein [Scytonema sp. PMC 1070.18]